jgi:hypothetical protein
MPFDSNNEGDKILLLLVKFSKDDWRLETSDAKPAISDRHLLFKTVITNYYLCLGLPTYNLI